MDFLDNVVKSSNALLKERLNNPFGKQQPGKQNENQSDTTSTTNQPPDGPTSSNTRGSSSKEAVNIPAEDSSNQVADDDRNGDKNSRFAAIAADAEAVTQNAVKGAKNIGTFLFSMANKAGQTVTQTAKQVKQAVENTSILTDLTREQQEFIKEHGGVLQAAELPWTDCEDESKALDIREQILSLSQDKRNFVRSPPTDANFNFDGQKYYPIALSLLKEDPNLGKMRFELVPKLVNEDTFWCNYFYRVSLLKQMSDRGDDVKRQGWTSSRSSSGEGPDEFSIINDELSQARDPSPTSAPNTTAIATELKSSILEKTSTIDEALNTNLTTDARSELDSNESRKLVAEADDLKSKLRELNIGSFDCGDADEDEKWEDEFQKDLQEFELISGDVSALDEEALDKEIMELKKSVKK